MKKLTKEEKNTCITLVCDYFKRSGIYVVPDMFHEADDDNKFLIGSTWIEYTLDIEGLPIRYTASISTMVEPSRFILNITNNGGIEHIDEYETFDIPEHLMQQYIIDPEGYAEEIQQKPEFNNWL